MKQILRIIAAFFLICILGTVCGAFLFILYVQCTSYVAGSETVVFSLGMFEAGILKSFPVALMLSPLFMILYLIRHPAKIGGAITFFIIQAFVWIFLFPFCARLLNFDASVYFAKNVVSTGYFRRYGNFLYYYSNISPSYNRSFEVGSGIRFKLSDLSVTQVKKPELVEKEALRKNLTDFSDSLAEELLKPPLLIQGIQNLLALPERIAQNFDTWLNYFIVLSMGLALMMLFFLRKLARWKLVDTLFVIISSVCILSVNSMYFNKLDLFAKISYSAQEILPLGIPLILCLNVLFILIYTITAVLLLFRKKGVEE